MHGFYKQKHRNPRNIIGFNMKSIGINRKAYVLIETQINNRQSTGFFVKSIRTNDKALVLLCKSIATNEKA